LRIADSKRGRAPSGDPVKDHAAMVKSPLQFIDETRQEVSKVTWPTWKEVWITTAMVLVMVAVTSIFFMLTDQIIAWLVQQVLRLGH
jgi:preprotein translocase subunit SecE